VIRHRREFDKPLEMWPYDICYVVCAISYIIAKTFMIHRNYLDELKVDELWMDFLLVICAIILNFASVFLITQGTTHVLAQAGGVFKVFRHSDPA